MTSSQRLIVVDPDLHGFSGHSFGYSMAVAEAAVARGLPAMILAARDADALHAAASVPLRPVFTRRTGLLTSFGLAGRLARVTDWLPAQAADVITDALRGGWDVVRTLSRPREREGFGDELSAALAGIGSTDTDTVLLHTVTSRQLSSLTTTMRPERVGQVIVVLRHPPAYMDRVLAAEPIGALLARMEGVFGGRLRLFADTAELACAYRGLAARPVGVVPPPAAVGRVKSGSLGMPPRIVFAGVARRERGYHLLPALLTPLLDRARVTVQHAPLPPDAQPSVRRAHRALRAMAGRGLNLIEHALDAAAYLHVLSSADLVLLPYLADVYGGRSSGVLTEALAFGIPAVLPAGGWMEREAGPERCIAFADPAEIAAALDTALAALPRLTAACRAGAASWRERHSPQALLGALLGPACANPDAVLPTAPSRARPTLTPDTYG